MFNCQSVVGGWQTVVVGSKELIGPVFNRINDLWQGQRENLYKDQMAEPGEHWQDFERVV